MNMHARILARRRQQLLARSIALRADLELQGQQMMASLSTVNTGLRVLDRFRKHPEWIAGAAMGLALIKPRRLSSIMRVGSAGLRTWRQVTPILQNLLAWRR
jgi:hypothetical protein